MGRLISVAMLLIAACSAAQAERSTPSVADDETESETRPVLSVRAGAAPFAIPEFIRWAYDAARETVSRLEPDQRLAQAAEILLDDVLSSAENPDRYQRNSAAIQAGVAEPVLLLLVVTSRVNGHSELERQLREQLAARCQPLGCNRLGIAHSQTTEQETLVVLVMASRLELEPVPMTVQAGQPVRITGRATFPTDRLEILVATPQGEVDSIASSTQTEFDVRYQPRMVGPHRFEILAQVEGSPTVLALFPICFGCRSPQIQTIPPLGETTSPTEAIRRLAQLINDTRESVGHQTLDMHESLEEAAQHHADHMASGSYFSHRDEQGRGPADRAAHVGIVSDLVLENIALAPTAEDAFVSFIDSPAHLRAMLHPDTTHIGIGIAQTPEEGLRVVVLMAQLEPRLEPELATSRVVDVIDAAREASEIPGLELEQSMSEAAAETAELLDRLIREGLNPSAAQQAAREALAARNLPSLRVVFMTTQSLDDAAVVEVALAREIHRAGIAALPASDITVGYHVVMLLAP